jgi:hypothetical protein
VAHTRSIYGIVSRRDLIRYKLFSFLAFIKKSAKEKGATNNKNRGLEVKRNEVEDETKQKEPKAK